LLAAVAAADLARATCSTVNFLLALVANLKDLETLFKAAFYLSFCALSIFLLLTSSIFFCLIRAAILAYCAFNLIMAALWSTASFLA